MALPISMGSGATVATDVVAGAHYGFNKIVDATAGSTNALVVDSAGSAQVAIKGNITLANSKGFIGLVTVANTVPVTGTFFQVNQPVSNVGNVTLDPGSFTGIKGNITIDSGVITSITNPVAITGNLSISSQVAWADPKAYIGLVTVANTVPVTGTFWQANQPVSNVGNVTLSDSKGYIGLVTATVGSNVAWADPKGYIGLVTITGALSAAAGNITLDPGSKTGIVGNITISDSKGYIGLVTVGGIGTITLSDPKGFIGLTTAVVGSNVAWSDPKGYIGLVTITGSLSPAAGNITLDAGSLTGIVGNITLANSKNFIGLVTVGNIVSTTFSGNVTLDAGSKTGLVGNITIDSGTITTITNPIALKGNVTIDSIANPIALKGNITITDSKGFIGLVTAVPAPTILSQGATISSFISTSSGFPMLVELTVDQTRMGAVSDALKVAVIGNVSISNVVATTWAGNITIDSGVITTITNPVAIKGNMTISDSKGYIGLVTVGGIGTITLADPKGFIGLTTVVNGQSWPDPKTYIGLVTVGHTVTVASHGLIGNLTLDAGSKVAIVGNVTISGTVTDTLVGNVTISDSKGFIGLTTSITLNGGTTKTLVNVPISFLSAGSQATIAVPTNAQQIYITNMLLNSDATVRISIKSGVTYLSGNASVGITLNPAGGFVYPGSVDSPVWIGLPSGALIIEKLDLTATSAKVGGNVMYYSQ